MRHPATKTWTFPAARPSPLPRTNLRELAAHPDRFEHHLVVVARIGTAQLELATASEPLYFAHANISDEYAAALPTGDPLLDAFPMRTFVSDRRTGGDVGRYNHHAGDLVLHPIDYLHWPGRLRPPYAPLVIPEGARRCGLSIVYCASTPTPPSPPGSSSAQEVARPPRRAGDVKPYVEPPPPLRLADLLADPPGVIARVGATELALVVDPDVIAPPRGGWVVVIAGDAPGELTRIPDGGHLDGAGIARALVLSGDAPPDAPPPSWDAPPPAPFAVHEDAPAGALPFAHGALAIEAGAGDTARVRIADVATEVPRYWLARLTFRVALHGLALGYVETYGGMYFDDGAASGGGPAGGADLRIGVRTAAGTAELAVPRADALAVLERLYRAVAPPGYRERLA